MATQDICIVVLGLWRYRIKSCRGEELITATFDRMGIEDDRRRMVIDTKKGLFLSQRTHPKLACVTPIAAANNRLQISAPKMPTISVPLQPKADSPRVQGKVWKDTLSTLIDDGDEAAEWFSDYLGTSCRLVYQPWDCERQISLNHTKTPSLVSLADGYPGLICSIESLICLNEYLRVPVSMTRFRPNVVVRGAQRPYQEDLWKHYYLANIQLENVKPCVRCPTINVDQETGEVDEDPPLEVLKKVRWSNEDPAGPRFGQNFVHRTLGTIMIGDVLIPTAKK